MNKKTYNSIIYATIILGAVLICIPLWWMITTAFKAEGEVFNFPPSLFPEKWRWENIPYIFEKLPFGRFFLNTFFLTAIVTVAEIFSSALVGYGFAKFRFKGRDSLFILMISTMMIPYHVTLVPQFMLFRELNWLDSYLPLFVPSLFGVPFFIFLYRQFFKGIPRDLIDAAIMDGCGYFYTFVRLILPMSLPVLGSVGIFSFRGVWNDFLRPLIYINSPEKRTVQLGIHALRDLHTIEWNAMMMATLLSMVPLIIMFALFQKKMIQGVVVSGVKE